MRFAESRLPIQPLQSATTPGLEQHVRTHQQSRPVGVPLVVDVGVVDQQRLALGECGVSAIASQPLAMAVHEWATNSAKHGTPSVETGTLTVAW